MIIIDDIALKWQAVYMSAEYRNYGKVKASEVAVCLLLQSNQLTLEIRAHFLVTPRNHATLLCA